jgi:hypothetical protein
MKIFAKIFSWSFLFGIVRNTIYPLYYSFIIIQEIKFNMCTLDYLSA